MPKAPYKGHTKGVNRRSREKRFGRRGIEKQCQGKKLKIMKRNVQNAHSVERRRAEKNGREKHGSKSDRGKELRQERRRR